MQSAGILYVYTFLLWSVSAYWPGTQLMWAVLLRVNAVTIISEIEEIDAALGISKKKSDRLRAPFILSAPNSVEADKIGISDGELITQYASDAVVLIKLRDALQKIVDTLTPKVPETTIAITHFKNWGETQDSLLLHVKPTEADQVIAFVKGVLILNENSETKV